MLTVVVACSSPSKPVTSPTPEPAPAPSDPAPPGEGPSAAKAETLAADTPKTTVAGNLFIAPAGWKLAVRGEATLLTPPEAGSAIAIVDVKAPDNEAAVKLAWAAYK